MLVEGRGVTSNYLYQNSIKLNCVSYYKKNKYKIYYYIIKNAYVVIVFESCVINHWY